MNNKISVITVVFNDVVNIRKTIESYFSQTWENKEYIVIDGGSTDGTKEIILEYIDRIDYWCSEKDEGIYEAMNTGIEHATGTWINFLNSGDTYVNKNTLKNIFENCKDTIHADFIYGNSIEIYQGDQMNKPANMDIRRMEFQPIYRHGSSLVRACIQKKYLFELNKKQKLGYALDWNMIHQAYKDGRKFEKVEVYIQTYQKEGTSNNLIKSLCYNYIITRNKLIDPKKGYFFIKQVFMALFTRTCLYRWLSAFLLEYTVNDILPHIPFWSIRKYILKLCRMKIGKKSFVMKQNYIMSPGHIEIGDYTDINRGCLLDARGGIYIGNNVSISHQVKIVTGGHDVQSKKFNAIYLPIFIDDYAWLGVGCTILQGIKIGKGAVVCAGAVVTHDVGDYEIVAGVPAKTIKTRTNDLKYHCIWDSPFT